MSIVSLRNKNILLETGLTVSRVARFDGQRIALHLTSELGHRRNCSSKSIPEAEEGGFLIHRADRARDELGHCKVALKYEWGTKL